MYQGKIAVLMGGPSREREISLRSGHAIAAALREKGYQTQEFLQMNDIVRRLKQNGIKIAFLALHGEFGEDGTIQSMLEKAGIAYTGSGPEASCRAFNKKDAKKCFYENDVPTPQWGLIHQYQKRFEIFSKGAFKEITLDKVSAYFRFPVAIKPVNEGSSIGISKIDCYEDLQCLLDENTIYAQLMIEDWVDGRELTVGVLDRSALPIVEIKTPGVFYDYRAKYLSGETQYQVIHGEEEQINKMNTYALKAYNALGCRDLARIDLILDDKGQIWVLEINTIPGFTNTSLLPKAARAIGIGFSDLCERILNMALLRCPRKSELIKKRTRII